MEVKNCFPTSWDNLVKGITVGTFILIVTLLIIIGLMSDSPFLLVALIILFSCVLFIPFLWAPQGFSVHDNSVNVKRFIGDKKILVVGKPKRWNWTWWGVRLFGSGGLYGYFGFFAFKGIGRVQMYSTNRHNLILVRDGKGKKYLLSPKEIDCFIKLLQKSTWRES